MRVKLSSKDILPTEATPREVLIFKVRTILRHLPGMMLFQDATSLPLISKHEVDVGYPDIIGSHHFNGGLRPFAFMVQVHGERSNVTREHWLERLRVHGWRTAVVNTPQEAIETLYK